MLARTHSVIWIAVIAFGPSAIADEPIRLNQIQVIGSHNSYHVAPHPNVLELIGATSPGTAKGLDYTHRPLPEQFSKLGIRQIELDVFADPDGGRYSDPSARKILQGLGKEPGPDPNLEGKLLKPGLKVFHVQDIDYISTASTFVESLTQVRDWSKANPRHVPILVLVELKETAIPTLPTRPAPFDAAALDSVDLEIRSVFQPDQILAPDDVRGNSTTLPEAIRSHGWPRLDDARGKVMFALDNEGAIRDRYLADHPALKGRAMFVTVDPGHPAAAWMKRNDAINDFDEIKQLIKDGFLVRTRADTDTVEARKDEPTRREKALASGAQFVSTDYPEPRLDFSKYRVRLPNEAVARSNPVNGVPSRAGGDLEAEGGN